MSATYSKRLALVNSLGALGYLSSALQWLWALIIIGYPMFASGDSWWLPGPKPTPITSQTTSSEPSIVMVVFAVIVVILTLTMTIYALVMLPRGIGKAGAAVTHKAANMMVPHVLHRKKLPESKRQLFTYQVVIWLKIFIMTLPILVLFILPIQTTLEPSIARLVGFFLFCWTLLYFSLQVFLTGILGVAKPKVW